MASTVSTSAPPGNIHCQMYCSITTVERAAFSMLPQLACGGAMPRPRNDSPASSRIAFAICSVA